MNILSFLRPVPYLFFADRCAITSRLFTPYGQPISHALPPTAIPRQVSNTRDAIWLVMYGTASDAATASFAPTFTAAASKMDGIIRMGFVDCSATASLCDSAGAGAGTALPAFRAFSWAPAAPIKFPSASGEQPKGPLERRPVKAAVAYSGPASEQARRFG